MKKNVKNIVISASGGLDSTCLILYWLAKGCNVQAFAFDYGQKHKIELKKLKRNIKFLSKVKELPVSLQIINLKDAFSTSASSLHVGGAAIPKGDYGEENMKSTVVENRNVIFSSIVYGKALSWANRTGEDVNISLGLHAGDHALYPDTTPESQKAAKKLFKISNWNSEKVDYVAPFVEIDKSEVLRSGVTAMTELGFTKDEINKVLKNTHSCYEPDWRGRSCGHCGTCTERIDAFDKLGMTDPVEYM